MICLLDTHTFLWFINDDGLLSITARQAIEDPANTILLSAASLWEMAIKVSTGKLIVPSPFAAFMEDQLNQNDIGLLAIKATHTELVATLPFHHRDPFDRLLIAQALTENLTVAGKDDAFDAYGVRRLW